MCGEFLNLTTSGIQGLVQSWEGHFHLYHPLFFFFKEIELTDHKLHKLFYT